MQSQLEFPFRHLIIPDRHWWTRTGVVERLQQALRHYQESLPAPPLEPVTVVLIGCSKSKLTTPAAARDLYQGQLFKKAVAWAERRGLEWFVVSALHGLSQPNQVREPYDFTIKDLHGRKEQEQWSHQVVTSQLARYAPKGSHAILIMPQLYRRYIEPRLFENGITHTNPLAGMGIGQQMQWLIRE